MALQRVQCDISIYGTVHKAANAFRIPHPRQRRSRTAQCCPQYCRQQTAKWSERLIRIFMVYTSFVLHKRLFMFCQSRFDEICPASEFSNSCLFQRSIHQTHNPKRGGGRRPLPHQLVHSRHLLQISLHGKLEHKASRFLINCLQHCFADYVLRAGLNCQALITFAPDG